MLTVSEVAGLGVEKEEKVLREYVIHTHYGSEMGLFLEFWVKTRKLFLMLLLFETDRLH